MDLSEEDDGPPAPKVSRMSSALSGSTSKSQVSNPRQTFFGNIDIEDGNGFIRRFPGPAGLINRISPTRQTSSSTVSIGDMQLMNMTRDPWRVMVQHLGLDGPEGLLQLLNIKWIKEKAVKQYPRPMKIPFLALVVLEGFSKKSGKCELKFMDASDNIIGAVDSSFIGVYGSDLIPGTAIAIRNASVMYDFNRRHLILPITDKNVLCLVSVATKSPVNENCTGTESQTTWHTGESGTSVKILNCMPFSIDSVMNEYNDLLMLETSPANDSFVTNDDFDDGNEEILLRASDIAEQNNRSFNLTPD